MIDGANLKIAMFEHEIGLRGERAEFRIHYGVEDALASILDGLQDMRDDSTLCQALADHPDFCELAARVACVKSLRSELADRDLTATERATLDRLASDPCDWIRNEARGALDDLADPLPDQVAAHDGAEDFEGGHTKGRKQSEACREIARLKIAHLRRMIGSIRLVLDRHLISAETEAEYERKKWRRNDRAGRFAKACLAKITELKESQCLTKS